MFYPNCYYSVYTNQSISRRGRYLRHPRPLIHSGWHVRAEKPNLFSYITNGSYAGRYNRKPKI